MSEYYLAIDIGASSGRHILGYLNHNKIELLEVYRFPNGMEQKNGHLCWDFNQLFQEIKNGLKKCKEINKIPKYIGIDTWGVDFVLLDQYDQVIGDTIGYRDKRTEGMDHIVNNYITQEDLYARTGIQKQLYNSIYQLIALKTYQPESLDLAKSFLMTPDYFHFLLTGIKKNEYTNATTTQLMNPFTKDWDYDLIQLLGLPTNIFKKPSLAGTIVGDFTKEIMDEVGFHSIVILPPTHDTASSVLAVPTTDNDCVYISSGTWSLMGIELLEANCSSESREANFTNEGGYNYRFRYLKNIMGLWMIQSVKKELNNTYSYSELCDMASKDTISSIIDCNHHRFLSPDNMIMEIKNYCKETNQPIPETPAKLAATIYNSLAKCYGNTIKEMESIMGRTYRNIHIIGGGSNAAYLNQLTATYTKKTVYAGPSETTAIGNIISQMLYDKKFATIEDARKCIFESFEVKTYN